MGLSVETQNFDLLLGTDIIENLDSFMCQVDQIMDLDSPKRL